MSFPFPQTSPTDVVQLLMQRILGGRADQPFQNAGQNVIQSLIGPLSGLMSGSQVPQPAIANPPVPGNPPLGQPPQQTVDVSSGLGPQEAPYPPGFEVPPPSAPAQGSFSGGGAVPNIDQARAAAPQATYPSAENPSGRSERDIIIEDLIGQNPSYAFLNALGPGYQKSWMMRDAAGRHANLIPGLAAMLGEGEGNSLLDFSNRYVKGLTSPGGGIAAGPILMQFLERASGGDEVAGQALMDMPLGDVLQIIGLAERQRGVNPEIVKARQRVNARRLENENFRLKTDMSTAPGRDDTASWARFLSQLAGR